MYGLVLDGSANNTSAVNMHFHGDAELHGFTVLNPLTRTGRVTFIKDYSVNIIFFTIANKFGIVA